MMYLAKLKLAATVVVVTTVSIGSNMQVRKAMAEDTTKRPETAEQSESGHPAQNWGDQKAGLTCSISPQKTTYRSGETIPVRFDLKNVSDKPQTVWHCGFWPNHRWIVQDASGRDLKLTDRGRLCRERYDDPRREKNVPVVIQPGKLDASRYGPYDLRRHFEIPEGTTIHIQCIYAHSADGRRVEITSNTLILTVGGPAAAQDKGVQCELIVPDRSWKIPENAEGKQTELDLALRITNRTGRALYFSRYDTIWPTLKSTSGKSYKLTAVTKRHRKPTTADYALVKSGDSVTFPIAIATRLVWRGGQLGLGGETWSGAMWGFRGLEAGDYELAVRYIMPKSRLASDIDVVGEDGATVMIPKDEVWMGEVQSAPVKITLAEQRVSWSEPTDGIAIRLEPVKPTVLPPAYTNEELLGFRLFVKNETDAEKTLKGHLAPASGGWVITDSKGDVWHPTFLPPPMPGQLPERKVRLKPGEARLFARLGTVTGVRRADKSDEKWYKVLPPGLCTVEIKNLRIGGISAPLNAPPVTLMAVDLKAVNGLQLSLRSDRTTLVAEPLVKVGAQENQPHYNQQVATLRFYFQNVGDEPIKLNAYDMVWSHLKLDVTGPDKDSVRRLKRLVEREMKAPEAKDFPTLPPGRKFMSYKASFPGTFGMFEYDLLKPGEYRINATYAAGGPGKHAHELEAGCWEGSVVSNEIMLTVRVSEGSRVRPH